MKSTRERLIDTARAMFADRGYGSTSVADLLRQASANSGSLYHHFPTKQDVLLAVLERYRDGIGPMLLETAWAGVTDPIDRIFALLAVYRTLLIESDCAYGCPIGSIALELHEPDPPVRRLLAENFDAWTGAVLACLEQADSQIAVEVDRSRLARFVLSVMEGAVMQARTQRSIEAFDDSIAVLGDYFDRLVGDA